MGQNIISNMEKTLWNIYKTFFKVGTLLLGGGYVILPLLQSELVEKKNWISSDEVAEYYALSQSIPGLIAANISIFTGYKLAGIKGAITAVSGIITPAFLSIVILAKVLEEIIKYDFVKGIFWGVGIGVIILLYLAVKEIWNKSIVDKYSFFVFLTVFIASLVFKISPAILVILAVISGIILQILKDRHSKKDCISEENKE